MDRVPLSRLTPSPTTPTRRRLWGAALAVIIALFQIVCTRTDLPEVQAQGQTRAPVPAGWRAYQDPMGFSLALPPAWSARTDATTGRAEISGPGAVLVIWPVFLENARLQPATASLVAQRLTARLWPDVVWNGAAPVGMNAVRLAGRRGDALVVSAFAWVESPRGTAGNFYAAIAPSARYAELADTFGRILASFRASGPRETQGQAPRPSAAVRYVKWMDPRENAFVVEVPEGWHVAGGMFRAASTDIRVGVTADSPDGQISLQLGDPSVPLFVEPSQQMAAAGLYEGSWYTPVPGNNFLIRRYFSAAYFLNEYVRSKMGPVCQQLQVDQPRDRSDAVQRINAMQAQLAGYGTSMQSTGAEISFSCERNGQQYRGYYFAITQITRTVPGAPANWSVSTQAGYLALASRSDEGKALAAHLLRSLEPNPQWLAMQQNITANTSRIMTQTNAEVSDMISSGYEGRQRTQDEVARRQTNVNRGQEDVVDTATGEQLKIESGANYYWMDYRGNIAGTDTATAPNADFHELMRQP